MKYKVEIILNCPSYWLVDNVVRFIGKFVTKEELGSIRVSEVEPKVYPTTNEVSFTVVNHTPGVITKGEGEIKLEGL